MLTRALQRFHCIEESGGPDGGDLGIDFEDGPHHNIGALVEIIMIAT